MSVEVVNKELQLSSTATLRKKHGAKSHLCPISKKRSWRCRDFGWKKSAVRFSSTPSHQIRSSILDSLPACIFDTVYYCTAFELEQSLAESLERESHRQRAESTLFTVTRLQSA